MPTLSPTQTQDILSTLHKRFEKNMHRHAGVSWEEVQKKLESQPHKLWSVLQMEETGGEPDVLAVKGKLEEIMFVDFCTQSPKSRRSLCYDEQALKSRKEHPPKGSAVGRAREMGVELLDENQYRLLQTVESVDTTTSSWIQTPPEIRKLGGALFSDRRYDSVFVYHNGAESYYAARGFRGFITL